MSLNVGIRGFKHGTNINDIVVPDALRIRRATGIDWFDVALGGEGFVPSTTMLLTGTPGAGKTTLLLQLAASVVKNGHCCLFNTGEQSLYQVKMMVERFGKVPNFNVGQDTMMSDILKHADSIRKANPGKQMFLFQDSLQTTDDGKWKDGANSSTFVRNTETLVEWASKTFGIVVCIGQVNKDGVFQGKNTILHAVDTKGHIFIDENEKSETFGNRLFEITKNRWGCSNMTMILDMEKTGLVEKGNISHLHKS